MQTLVDFVSVIVPATVIVAGALGVCAIVGAVLVAISRKGEE